MRIEYTITSNEFSSEKKITPHLEDSFFDNLPSMHIVELPDKTRVAQYNSPPVTEAEATEAVLASYAAAGEILQVAETTARHLGQSARSLLEMAITRLTNAEQRENNSDN